MSEMNPIEREQKKKQLRKPSAIPDGNVSAGC